jgi:hypothetical protein
VIFGAKILFKKRVPKTLMALMSVVNIINILRAAFAPTFLQKIRKPNRN